MTARTPPPGMTSDVTTTTSTTTVTTATESASRGERSYTSQITAQINQESDTDQQRLELAAKDLDAPEDVDEKGKKDRAVPLCNCVMLLNLRLKTEQLCRWKVKEERRKERD